MPLVQGLDFESLTGMVRFAPEYEGRKPPLMAGALL